MANEFKSLGVASQLIQVLDELTFRKPTPIQIQSIPLILKGRDVIGQAKTGSGKTAAFALPILQHLEVSPRRLQALILCPTRELCTQVAGEVRKLGRRLSGLQILMLSGGNPMTPQVRALSKGVHVVVGTPGRVLDHLRRGTLRLNELSVLVLDEADRMLDMGFKDQMKAILAEAPVQRQTVLFSATFPPLIEEIAREYLRDPVQVTIGEEGATTSTIEQNYYQAPDPVKLSALQWILGQNDVDSALVFCNQKATVHKVAQELEAAGCSAAGLHGDLEQSDRDRVMAKFRNRSTRVLVATDVAARGLDVPELDLVINWDLPPKPDVYVHRVGRTGRAGRKGMAISLVAPNQLHLLRHIEKATSLRVPGIKVPTDVEMDRGIFKLRRQTPKMATLFIAGGRKDKLRPGDILGALTGDAGGLEASQIGKIEVHDHFSYVAVSISASRVALDRLRNGKIKGRKFRIEPVR